MLEIDIPEDDDILEKSEEDKDDADTHPDIQCWHIAHSGSVLSHSPKHGGQGEEGGHGHGHPPGDGLRGQEEREPGNDHKQSWKKVWMRISR